MVNEFKTDEFQAKHVTDVLLCQLVTMSNLFLSNRFKEKKEGRGGDKEPLRDEKTFKTLRIFM